VLFPGVDPTTSVEILGAEHGKSILEKTFVNIPMGQGQEIVAETALDLAAKEGHWIMLQNIHLMENWSKKLEVRLEKAMTTAHDEFRC
jgi:dynein heavy chain